MNISPLRFHAVHGRYVEVSSDGSEARNTSEDVLGPGVAFANRPLAIDETVCLRITTPYWPLAELPFGFTWYDPSSLIEAVQSKTWYPILLDIRLEKPNFYINMRSSGELHFWGEGGVSSRCVAGVDMNVPVWLVVQLPSVPASVKFVEEITEQPPCGYIYNLLPFYFHKIHGINVKIVGQEAYCKRRTRKSRKGATFTSRPVRVNERVCLRIHGVNEDTDIQIGFTNQDPVSWARRSTHVVHRKKLIRHTRYWVKLLENHLYKNASNIFFYINSARDISFGVDGQKLGHIPSGVDINSNIWATVVVSGKDVNIGFANAEFRQRAHEYSLLVNDSLCSNMAALGMEESSSAEKNQDRTHTVVSTSTKSTADTTESQIESQTESRSSECSICSDGQANAVLLPCSHMCTCHECALKLWENELHRYCPICRVGIVKILRIYPC